MNSPNEPNLFERAWDRAERTSGVDWNKLGFGYFGAEEFFFFHLPTAVVGEVLGVLGGETRACSNRALSAVKDFALGPKSGNDVRTGWKFHMPKNCPQEARGAYAIQGWLCEALPRNLVAGLRTLFGTRVSEVSSQQE